jgi:L-alanine-DL-glutamate epimerase-like enolase superfamily enzyme
LKITDVQAIPLRVPSGDEIGLDGSQDDLLIRIQTDKGIEGIGEVDSSPEVVKAIVEAPASHSWSRGLRELLVGEDPSETERLWEKLYRGSVYYGRRGVTINAISGIDIALWDLKGKIQGKSISELLGVRYRDKIPVYASLYSYGERPEDIAKSAARAVEQGFKAVKLDGSPLGQEDGSDRKILAATRETIGNKVNLLTDVAEPGWNLTEAVARARMYSEFGVFFLEAPFGPDELDNYKALTDSVELRIAYGEQHTTRFEFQDLVEKGGIEVIQPDVSRVGGITEVLRIAQYAQKMDIMLIPHCWKSGVSIAANLHLLTAITNAPYLEFSQPPESPLRYTLLKRDFSVENGQVKAPTGPGLGIDINESTVEKYRLN